MKLRPARVASGLFIVAVCAGLVVHAAGLMSDRPQRGDAAGNLKRAANVFRHGVYSSHYEQAPPWTPPPDFRREPAIPVLLGAWFALVGDPETMTQACLLEAQPACQGVLRSAKWLYVAMLLAMALATGWATRLLVPRGPAPLVAFVLIAVNGCLWHVYQRFQTELPAALLLTLASACLYKAASGSSRWRYPVGAGLALGVLILTRAIFLYVAPGLLIVAGLLALQRRRGPALRTAAACALALAIAGAWIARNVAAGGPFAISSARSVVAIRAEYATMTWREWRAAWFFFVRDEPWAAFALEHWFEPEDYRRLERHHDASYYERAKHPAGVVAARIDVEQPTEAQMADAAWDVIRDNLGMHVALSGPFALRGTFTWTKHFDRNPKLRMLLRPISKLLLPAFLFASLLALWRRDWVLFSFFALGFGSWVLHTALTHHLARYSWPLLPGGAVALAALPSLLRSRGRQHAAHSS